MISIQMDTEKVSGIGFIFALVVTVNINGYNIFIIQFLSLSVLH